MRKAIDVDKSNPPSPPFAKGGMGGFSGQKGVTLTELLIVLAIFSIVIAGVYGVYITQVKHTTREHRIAESEMELDIIKNFIERDIAMAGYGLADDYGGLTFISTPRPIGASDNITPGITINPATGSAYPGTVTAGSDAIHMMGTALGRLSRGAQGWSYIVTATPTFKTWGDAREDIQAGDRVMYMEPNTKTILASGSQWLFNYPTSPTTERGTIVYGLRLSGENINQPYYIVQYRLGGAPPAICSGPGSGVNAVRSLIRGETSVGESAMPVLDCVRDLQVAFGLDTNEDGTIDFWDNGGIQADTYGNKALRERLKHVKVYMLVQLGMRDPDRMVYPAGQSFRVGDATLGTGRDVILTDEQRWYRWRVVSFSITPRNLR